MSSFTKQDHERKSAKAKRTREVLHVVKEGQGDNLIILKELFLRKIYINNRKMYNQVIKEA